MFALLLLLCRSHNAAGDGEPRERLFEGASSPADTGQTTRCKTLPIPCDRLLRACDRSLPLSVVGSKCLRPPPLRLPLRLLCDVEAAPARATEDRTPSNPMNGFLALIGSCLKLLN